VDHGTNSILILCGYGDRNFSSPLIHITGDDSLPFSVVTGYFNRDKHLDLAVANHSTNNMWFFSNNGSRIYSVVAGHWNSCFVATSTQETHLDLLLGYGSGSFAHHVTLFTENLLNDLVVGDVNAGYWLDIIVAHSEDMKVGIFLGYGNDSFRAQMQYPTATNSEPYANALVDFNNDDRFDLVVANYHANNVSVLLTRGQSSFENEFACALNDGSRLLDTSLADLHNDGRIDIDVMNAYENGISVLLGYGNSSFVTEMTYPTGLSHML
jgi:hypothetical protein